MSIALVEPVAFQDPEDNQDSPDFQVRSLNGPATGVHQRFFHIHREVVASCTESCVLCVTTYMNLLISTFFIFFQGLLVLQESKEREDFQEHLAAAELL